MLDQTLQQTQADSQFQITQVATTVPTLVVNTIKRNPGTNTFVNFDASNTFSNPAIKQAGLASKVKIYGYDGNSDQIAAVRAGDVRADAAAPWEWGGWAAVDLIARKKTGDANWAETPHSLPWRLITKENAPAKGAWQGDIDFRAKFSELWGK